MWEVARGDAPDKRPGRKRVRAQIYEGVPAPSQEAPRARRVVR